jgi:two-component system response regulator RegX3
MRIALVEDDLDQAEVLKAWLLPLEGSVTHFELGEPLLRELKHEHFDLFLLDWQLPDISGIELVKWIRQHMDWSVPVIFLTIRNSEEDIVTALEAGADDYIAKPLVHGVTMARIRSVLRRARAPEAMTKIDAPPFTIELDRHRVTLAGELIPTTQREFELAAYFFHNVGRVLSRDTLLKEVWGIAQQLNTRTVDTHVCRIRSKLNIKPENGWQLTSIYQFGYRLENLATATEALA